MSGRIKYAGHITLFPRSTYIHSGTPEPTYSVTFSLSPPGALDSRYFTLKERIHGFERTCLVETISDTLVLLFFQFYRSPALGTKLWKLGMLFISCSNIQQI